MLFYMECHAHRYHIAIMRGLCEEIVMRWGLAEGMEMVPWTKQVQNWLAATHHIKCLSVCMPLLTAVAAAMAEIW